MLKRSLRGTITGSMATESTLERLTGLIRSENGRLSICAVCASLLTVGTIYGIQYKGSKDRNHELRKKALADAAIPHETIQLNAAGGEAKPEKDMSEDLIREQLSRNYLFFGDDGMEKIRQSFVIVVGVGGVGSWATTMLVR